MTNGRSVRRNIPAAFFAVAVFAPILWMAIDRDLPYVRTSGEIVPADPAPGDFVSVRWHIKVNRWCRPNVPRNVTRQIITSDGQIIDYEPVEGVYGSEDRTLTDNTRLDRTFQLPPSLPPGPAIYASSACFSCNPLQDIWPVCVDTPKLNFNVRHK